MGIYAATVSKRNRKQTEEAPYESQFSKS
jgi:hypothetical protein